MLALRKHQCEELSEVVRRGVEIELAAAEEGTINYAWFVGLQKEAKQKVAAIHDQSPEAFNSNVHFTAEVTETVQLVPKVFPKWNTAVGVQVLSDGLPEKYAMIVAGAYKCDPMGPTANARPHLINGCGGHIYATANGDWVLNCAFTPSHLHGVATIEVHGGALPVGRREW